MNCKNTLPRLILKEKTEERGQRQTVKNYHYYCYY
jgi:hypothetical protein